MSHQRSSSGISSEDRRVLRLFKIISCEGHHTLLNVFKWGYQNDSAKPITTYLNEKGWTHREVKRYFDSTMREKINSNADSSKYDICLLHVCIKFGCDGLAFHTDQSSWQEGSDNLESLCTSVKNYRNRLVHAMDTFPGEQQMRDLCSSFKEILKKILFKAGNKYGKGDEVDDEIKMMEDNVENILRAPLAPADISQYVKEIKELREEQKKIVLEVGNTQLPNLYKTMTKVDPASFITGKERLEIKKMFTELEVVQKKQGGPSKKVDYEGLLDLKTEEDETPTVWIVEGEAGAGKTTLSKLILDNWADIKIDGTSPTIRGLEEFDIILYTEGRNKKVSSLLDLLMVLMPRADAKLTHEDLVQSLLKLKVLLIIDGLDERNPASRQLITDLLDKQIPASDNKLKLLMTTRPHMLQELPSIIRNHVMVHTQLKGISPDKCEEFVSTLHNQMKAEGQSIQNTELLVDFVRSSRAQLRKHYRLPLNLTLLTYLWAADPPSVISVTTATELYIALHNLVQKRLLRRLQDLGNVTELSTHEIERCCETFLHQLHNVCLETLSSGSMQLSEDSVYKLRKECTELCLNFDEMTAPFLSVEKDWCATGYKFDLFIPHKSIMEFYAAHRFMYFMIQPEREVRKELDAVVKCLEQAYRRPLTKEEKEDHRIKIAKRHLTLQELVQNILKKDMMKDSLSHYQNMFLHLGGLLAHEHGPKVLQKYAKELVDACEWAEVKGHQWLNLVVETNCNQHVARLVANQDITKLGVRDGHTGAALALFEYLPTNTPIEIILETEVRYVPRLKDLLEKVATLDCHLEVLLKYQWKNKECGMSDSLLSPLFHQDARCTLSRVTGNLENLTVLPKTLENLRVLLTDDHQAQNVLQQLNDLVSSRHFSLGYLGFHVMRDVSGISLRHLPTRKATLWLSGVLGTDLDRVLQIIIPLASPTMEYSGLFFPGSSLSPDDVKALVVKLGQNNIRINRIAGIHVNCRALTKLDRFDLLNFTREHLNCELYCTDDRSMW